MNKLERYDIEEKDLPDSSYEQKMILISEGEWVKYEDVKELEAKIAEIESEWVSIADAPKGGADRCDDPEWIEPPKILLLFNKDIVSVGYWDWYYAEGGRGYEGGLAWIEPISGERLDLNYDIPIGWKPITPPKDKG